MKCIIKRSPFPNQTMVGRVYDDVAHEMVRVWGWKYCPKRVWKEAMLGRSYRNIKTQEKSKR